MACLGLTLGSLLSGLSGVCMNTLSLLLKVNESQLYAKVDFESRMRSAEFLAYPPVIAGILHTRWCVC